MRRHMLWRAGIISLLFLLPLRTHAQGMYGAEAGAGKATTGKSVKTLTLKGYWEGRLSRSFYLGASLLYERYSFTKSYNLSAGGDIISIQQKSAYVFLSPTLDWGIGYRKYWHLHVSVGPGLLAGGSQFTNLYTPYLTTPSITTKYDTVAHYTSSNLPILATRISIGFSERIPTRRFWNIMLTQEFGYIPSNLTTHGPNLRTNYFAFTVGIMHKYPMTFVEY